MRYWSYLAAKIGVATGIFLGLVALLNWWWPVEQQVFRDTLAHKQMSYTMPRFGWDLGFTSVALLLFLLWTVSLNFIWRDQKHRCRVCLRKLRMPVETGSWHRMLQFGRPSIEYICPYGHGTLKEDELQISGLADAEWTPHSDDIWAELAASAKEGDERP
jgi:hypothetical protein